MTYLRDRVFDRIPSVRTASDWLVSDLLTVPSAYDKLQDAKTKALAARVAVLEGKVPPQPGPVPPSTTILWSVKDNLDQKQTGMCVGYGWSDLVQSAPKPEVIVDGSGGPAEGSTPDKIYDLAQKYDGSASDDNTGASVKGGAEGAKALGFIAAYHFCSTYSDIVAAIKLGPVVMGTNWLNDMFNPDDAGLIHATGAVAGGHCYLIRGYDPVKDLFRIRNSWGVSWGVSGDAFISGTDVAALFAAQGDAVLATKI